MKTTAAIPLTTYRIYRAKIIFILLFTATLLVQNSHAQGRRGSGDRQPGANRSEGFNRGTNNNRGNIQRERSNNRQETGRINPTPSTPRTMTRRSDFPATTRPQTNDRPAISNNGPANNNRFNNERRDRPTPQVNNRINGTNDWGRVNGNNHNNDYNRNRGNNWNNNRPNNRTTVIYNNSYRYNNHYYRPVYNAGNPNWRYGYLPRRNSVFNILPSTYLSINFGGFGYRYYDGIYYRPYNSTFVVTAPPIGIFIHTLPIGYRRIYVRDYPYYYYNGTYYDQKDDNYYVVSPPVGAVVESIPDGFETVVIDGETFYTVDGAQYKPAVQENGEIWYEVIKAN